MAFSISVVRRSDMGMFADPPADVRSPAFAAWEEAARACTVFDAALGSDGVVGRYWSSLAAEAGLPLLASMYEAGLEVGGDDLDRLSDELAALQQMWASTIDPLATIAFSALGHRGEAPLIYDLVFHRAELLRLAIRVARAIDGCVRID